MIRVGEKVLSIRINNTTQILQIWSLYEVINYNHSLL